MKNWLRWPQRWGTQCLPKRSTSVARPKPPSVCAAWSRKPCKRRSRRTSACRLCSTGFRVYLQDSSTVSLPDALQKHWRGCETWTDQGGKAALKIQVHSTWARRRSLAAGTRPRQRSSHAPASRGDRTGVAAPPPSGLIRPRCFATHSREKGVFHQPRSGRHSVVRRGRRTDRAGEVFGKCKVKRLDRPVRLGVGHRLPCRLIAVRVPPEVARRRRKTVLEGGKETVRPFAGKAGPLGGNIYVTNAPKKLLSLDEVLVLARMRWQIELLFKLGNPRRLGATHSEKPWRILCETFAKLLAQLIQHWILIQVSWSEPRRSLRKAAVAVRAFAASLATSLKDLDAGRRFGQHRPRAHKDWPRGKASKASQCLPATCGPNRLRLQNLRISLMHMGLRRAVPPYLLTFARSYITRAPPSIATGNRATGQWDALLPSESRIALATWLASTACPWA